MFPISRKAITTTTKCVSFGNAPANSWVIWWLMIQPAGDIQGSLLLYIFSPDAHLFSYFGVISYLHHSVEEEKFGKIKFITFTFLRKAQIVNLQRKVVLFPQYFKDYIVCVECFSHFPLIITSYLLTLFWSTSSVIFLS